MHRLISRSLDIEEPMTPKEKEVQRLFFGKENTLLVHGSAQRHVNPSMSYSTVVDAMHKQFTVGLGGSDPVDVASLNQATIDGLYDSYQKHVKAVEHTREVGFEKSRIPSNMLPRPSFNLQEDAEFVGKHQIILR